MKDILRKYPRLVGAALILVGIGLAVSLKQSYDTGDSVREKTIIGVPVLFLWGLAIMVQPRLMLLDGEFGSAPTRDKAAIIVIVMAGVGLGVMLRHQVFGAWQ